MINAYSSMLNWITDCSVESNCREARVKTEKSIRKSLQYSDKY